MARPPMFKPAEKQRIVLSVLRGECSVAEAARRNKCSETSVAKWRDQFLAAGMSALEEGARRGPSAREAELERELAEVTSAPGEAHVELRLLKRDGAAVSLRGAGDDPPRRRAERRAVLRGGRDPAAHLVPPAGPRGRRPAGEGSVARPVSDRVVAVVHAYALRYPAWGHRKIWGSVRGSV